MFFLVVDVFMNEILDYLDNDDLQCVNKVIPGIVRLYKSSYLDQCISYHTNMYVECSLCHQIYTGKFRRGLYICTPCLCERITINIS